MGYCNTFSDRCIAGGAQEQPSYDKKAFMAYIKVMPGSWPA